jgi:hypothetical protein
VPLPPKLPKNRKALNVLTFGTIIAIVLLGVAALAILIAIIAFVIDEPGTGLCFIGVALILALFPLIGWLQIGFNPEYMAYRHVEGNVEQVASRQIAEKGGMSQRYVVVIDGRPYAIDDTRAALLKAGDHISLQCVREFDWGSTDNGYACKWA